MVFVLITFWNRFWIKCLLNQQKSSGLLLWDIPRKTGAMNSFHVRTYQCLHSSVFTIASVPDRVGIKMLGRRLAWECPSIGAQVTYFISPCFLISLHCPNTADKWRVVLKAKRLDYINASFVNVGIKHVAIHSNYTQLQYNDTMLSLCRATSNTKGSSLHRPLWRTPVRISGRWCLRGGVGW